MKASPELGDTRERPASRSQRAADEIRAMIVDGRLRPGARVNELSIARALGMSRGPVREAVGRLASSGLLVEEPNVGARVIAPDFASTRELFLVRELLESQAAFEAAESMSDEERHRLRSVLDEHETLLEEVGTSGYPHSANDEDFHRLILHGSRNRLIERICGSELRDIFLLMRSRHNRRGTRGRQALKEHRRIAEAIMENNAELAAVLMRQHIRASRDVFLEMMSGAGSVESARSARA